LQNREVPTGSHWLIISFGDPLDIVSMPHSSQPAGRFVSFIVGLQEGAALTEHGGRQHGMQVELTPLGTQALLGVAPGEATNACVELADVLGADADRLAARLAETPDWPARFSILHQFLEARVDDEAMVAPEVAWAWRRLGQSAGQVGIDELVREVGWSRRHLAARFREQVGLAPKVLARILRFQHALGLAGQSPSPSWAEIAAMSGYFDQAHLIRDFRALAGCSPTEYTATLLPGVEAPAVPVHG
jgi:AraC-like DNA-binding protein